MRFEFDTTTDGAKEAAALVSAVALLYGPGVLEAIEVAADRMDAPTITVNNTVTAPKAADGYVAPAGALDTAGIPWDERIHASTKTTNKDGTWSRRRNTPDATHDAVMAELKAGTTKEASAADAFADPTNSAAPVEPVTDGPSTEAASAGPTATTAASPTETVVVVPPPPAPTGVVTFPQLMVKITKAQTAGTIDKAKVDEFLGAFGLTKIAELASAGADTIGAVNAMVDEHVAN